MSDTNEDLGQQVTELQITVAYLEDAIERLDKVIATQDRDLQNMQRQLQLIYAQIEGKNNDQGVAPFDVTADKPPHY